MISVDRAWLAFAAIGAGTIHLALVVGSPTALAIVLALLGAAEVGWGVAALARTSVPAVRASLLAALGATAISLAAAAVLAPRPAETAGDATTLAGPASALLIVASLDGAIALILAASLMLRRRHPARITAGRTAPPHLSGPRIARSLLAMAAGALVVGALTTPALAATEAGRRAQPHGAHLLPAAPGDPVDAPRPEGHEGH